jgi:hypothetical protein
MSIKYELQNNGYIQMDNDGIISTIPNDPSNSDYQAYLAANSTPSVAPVVTPVVTPADPVTP